MLSKKKILIVEDNLINRMMLSSILSGQYEVLEAENGLEALSVLGQWGEAIAIILLDIRMPVMDGYEFLARFKAEPAYSSIPVIVTTQSDDEADEVNALSHGATDFVSKPYKAQIILHRVASIISLRESAALINLVQYDRLTGLYGKEFFYRKAREILRQNPDKAYDIICSDVENFKLVNDVLGTEAGDRLLCGIAGLYRRFVGDLGICGRFNADQFACLVEHKEDYTEEMFQEAAFEVNRLPGAQNIVMKWGVYPVEDRGISVEQMCDRALMSACGIKGQYGKFFAMYDDALRSRLLREQAIKDSMECALESGQFEIYIQPQYRVRDNGLVGGEVLIRWNHPEWGLQPPAVFIPLFEKNGFITRLDRYVWEQACATIKKWDEAGYPLIPLSVNVSRADIYNVDLPGTMTGLIEKYGLAPSRIHLEITESAYTEDMERIVDTVRNLRELGFIVEMDDFGSGYSSLNMLNEMPIDVLKLDMKFIQNETAKQGGRGILFFIVGLARWMNLNVVAEGVETWEQLEHLRKIGCDYVQGYYFARPMRVKDFEKLLIRQGVDVIHNPTAKTLPGSAYNRYQGSRTGQGADGAGASQGGTVAEEAGEVIWRFCRAWFERRNAEEVLAFLADDVILLGPGEKEEACGIGEMTDYLWRDILEIPEPFQFELSEVSEQKLSERLVTLNTELTLRNSLYAWYLRCVFVLERDGAGWLIRNLHFSEPGKNQQPGEHYPRMLALENAARQRQGGSKAIQKQKA